jgi:hypothetical protein
LSIINNKFERKDCKVVVEFRSKRALVEELRLRVVNKESSVEVEDIDGENEEKLKEHIDK